jgi:hypothetical protein
VNWRDSQGNSLLHLACMQQQVFPLRFLIEVIIREKEMVKRPQAAIIYGELRLIDENEFFFTLIFFLIFIFYIEQSKHKCGKSVRTSSRSRFMHF